MQQIDFPKTKQARSGAMARLSAGVKAFRDQAFPKRRKLFEELAAGQSPQTLFITCADSRVVPELITQTQPGELFVCRNIGNVVPAYGEMMGGVSAVVEYACTALEVTDIVVCGHSDCGAMKALLTPDDPNLRRMPTVASWLRNAEAARSVVAASQPELDGAARIKALIEQNVRLQLAHLATHPAVASRQAAGKLALHGWVYGIETGSVAALDTGTGAFAPLDAGDRR
jgi:carbonic anhydrase